MKVGEVRKKISTLKKDEIIKLAVEFYKLVPKSKKEDYDLDGLINNPQEKKKSSSKTQASLGLLEYEINEFIENAKSQNYLIPNRVVPKKERPKWRFKVKKWYKEIINTNRTDLDKALQAKLLSDLYELLCESCGYQYFSAYDPFQSIGIEQREFFKSTINLIQESEGKSASVEKGIKLVVDNFLNRYTLYSELMNELTLTLDVPNLKYMGIEIAKKEIKKMNAESNQKSKKNRWGRSSLESYRQKRKNNNLAELGFKLHASLFELDEAVTFYKENYQDKTKEVKLYVLVTLLFSLGKKDRIVKEIEEARKKGVEPREKLLDLVEKIKNTGKLPKYI